MPQLRSTPLRTCRLIIAAAALCAGAAFADDYSDVSRMTRAGQHAQALQRAEQYLAAKPRDPQMLFLKGVVQTEMGRTGDALATFTKLTEDYPELPEPYNNLAVLYAAQNQLDKARASLELAVRTNPDYSTAHENLGDIYVRLAGQAYGRAAQLDAGNARIAPKLSLIRQLLAPAGRSGS